MEGVEEHFLLLVHQNKIDPHTCLLVKTLEIKLLECPIPPLSVLLLCPLSQKIRITSVLAVFLKLGQMDFSKASNMGKTKVTV